MQVKSSKRKVLSLIVAMAMVIGMMPATLFAVDFSDVSGHWGQAAIERWTEYGILNGYEDGTFKPEKLITRAEVAKILDAAIGYQDLGTTSFNDVNEGSWYYEHIMRLAEAGVMQGSAGNARPGDNITRQEAVVLIARAFAITGGADSGAFADDAAIAEWAKAAVQSMKDNGYVQGDEGGFRPGDSIKRAELVTILSNVLSGYYNAEGTYEGVETIAGNVAVAAANVVLKDIVIEGDLYVLQGVGEGDANFENITVKGTVHVWGGGANSVYFKGSTIATLAMGKNESRVVLQDGTSVEITLAEAGELLTQRDVTIGELVVGEGVKATIGNDVTVEKATVTGELENLGTIRELTVEDGTVVNTGTLTKVELTGAVSFESTDAGKIGEITVSEDVDAESTIKLDSPVEKLVVDTTVDITGKGKVDQAEVNADSVTFETAPVEIVVSEDVTVPPESETTAPVDPGSGDGGEDPIVVITLSSIAITTAPTKTVYFVGEELDLTGLVVTGTYSNGSKKEETITAANISYDKTTPGTNVVVTVTVNGKIATFTITLKAKEVLTSITNPADINVAFGTAYADVLKLLPATVAIVTNGTINEASVTWPTTVESSVYDPAKAGDNTIVGDVTLPDNVVNTNEVSEKATVKVIVASETDSTEAQKVITLIDAISTADDYDAAVAAAREAYGKLNDAQKALVTNYDVLVLAEKIVAFRTAHAAILTKALADIGLADRDAVAVAITAYLNLSEDAQEALSTEYDNLAAKAKKIGELQLADAKTKVEGATYAAISNADVTEENDIVDAIKGAISKLSLAEGITYTVNKGSYTPAVDGVDGTAEQIAGTDGTYKFTVTLQLGADEEGAVTTAEKTVTIEAVPYTAPLKQINVKNAPTVKSKVYDGTTAAELNDNGEYEGIVGTDDVQVVATAVYKDAAVGASKEITISYALTGDDAGKYQAPGNSTGNTGIITAKELTISGVTATYIPAVEAGKGTVELGGTAKLEGIVGSDVVTLDDADVEAKLAELSGSETSAADHAVVVTGYKLTGAQAGNYTVKQPDGLKVDSRAVLTLEELTVELAIGAEEIVLTKPDAVAGYKFYFTSSNTTATPPAYGDTIVAQVEIDADKTISASDKIYIQVYKADAETHKIVGYVQVEATPIPKITLSGDSGASAGDREITGLNEGDYYVMQVGDGAFFPVVVESGGVISGLSNDKSYTLNNFDVWPVVTTTVFYHTNTSMPLVAGAPGSLTDGKIKIDLDKATMGKQEGIDNPLAGLAIDGLTTGNDLSKSKFEVYYESPDGIEKYTCYWDDADGRYVVGDEEKTPVAPGTPVAFLFVEDGYTVGTDTDIGGQFVVYLGIEAVADDTIFIKDQNDAWYLLKITTTLANP